MYRLQIIGYHFQTFFLWHDLGVSVVHSGPNLKWHRLSAEPARKTCIVPWHWGLLHCISFYRNPCHTVLNVTSTTVIVVSCEKRKFLFSRIRVKVLLAGSCLIHIRKINHADVWQDLFQCRWPLLIFMAWSELPSDTFKGGRQPPLLAWASPGASLWMSTPVPNIWDVYVLALGIPSSILTCHSVLPSDSISGSHLGLRS